jgi:hypothetical protein
MSRRYRPPLPGQLWLPFLEPEFAMEEDPVDGVAKSTDPPVVPRRKTGETLN